MNGFYIAWRNLITKPLRFFFNILLIAIAAGLITITLLIDIQFKDHFEKNLDDVDLILCAKGSPLQTVLCNLFHIDAPTGNIDLKEARVFLNPEHPIIKAAIPLALGDQFNGYRIVGTTLEYFPWFNLELNSGAYFKKDLDAVIGSAVAKELKLALGSEFLSGHGLVTDGDMTHSHDQQFQVTGILKQTGGVLDRLIFVSISSYWAMHPVEDEEGHPAHTQDIPCIDNRSLKDKEGQITSVLLSFKGTNIQSLNFGRSINENTGMMAANPAIELNRLYELTGSASELVTILAILLTLLATLSLFISIWQAMEERKFEIAVLRLGGASFNKILFWILLEGFILSSIGLLIGIFFAHILLTVLSSSLELQIKYGIEGLVFVKEEFLLFGIGIGLGLVSCLIPAIKVIRRDIHQTLSS
ncbi:MAG: ABC transporter permease [Saprospiraceae bacterium]|nr:ABC transporter permease [Saprospiraceae bacterium]